MSTGGCPDRVGDSRARRRHRAADAALERRRLRAGPAPARSRRRREGGAAPIRPGARALAVAAGFDTLGLALQSKLGSTVARRGAHRRALGRAGRDGRRDRPDRTRRARRPDLRCRAPDRRHRTAFRRALTRGRRAAARARPGAARDHQRRRPAAVGGRRAGRRWAGARSGPERRRPGPSRGGCRPGAARWRCVDARAGGRTAVDAPAGLPRRRGLALRVRAFGRREAAQEPCASRDRLERRPRASRHALESRHRRRRRLASPRGLRVGRRGFPGTLVALYVPLAFAAFVNLARLASMRIDASTVVAATVAFAAIAPFAAWRFVTARSRAAAVPNSSRSRSRWPSCSRADRSRACSTNRLLRSSPQWPPAQSPRRCSQGGTIAFGFPGGVSPGSRCATRPASSSPRCVHDPPPQLSGNRLDPRVETAAEPSRLSIQLTFRPARRSPTPSSRSSGSRTRCGKRGRSSASGASSGRRWQRPSWS